MSRWPSGPPHPESDVTSPRRVSRAWPSNPTDPDADRVGIAIKNNKGEFILVNGNQAACLLIRYVLTAWEKAGKITGSQYVVKTIVTSYLIDKIAASKKVECFNTLTGFKYIGQIMTQLEGKKTFIAGGEESYGYLVGEHARDKDAVDRDVAVVERIEGEAVPAPALHDALDAKIGVQDPLPGKPCDNEG